MRVTLLQQNEDLLDIMYTAARTCYSSFGTAFLHAAASSTSEEKKLKLVNRVLKSGHLSIAEHIIFTFGIDGISRACSHQLVRHRLCTFSQQSQRYVNFDKLDFEYIMPPAIENTSGTNDDFATQYKALMHKIKNLYDDMVEYGIKPEDARYIFPNAAATNIVVSTNLRNLMHMANLRLCTRAQWEVRQVFYNMTRLVSNSYPWLAEYLQPSCELQGFCTEDKCCGRKPKLESINGTKD